MRRALLLLLLPALAFADPPPEPPEGHEHVVLEQGQPAPAQGIFADSKAALYDFERLRWLRAELEACRTVAEQERAPSTPWWAWTGLGIVLGGGVVLAARKL